MGEALKRILPSPVRARLRTGVEALLKRSIHAAADEQGLSATVANLSRWCPDLRHQYSTVALESEYLLAKVRAQHAFQVRLACAALDDVGEGTVVDIGDSAGTHVRYLQETYPAKRLNFLSVNMDEEAVRKIRERGYEAVCARAEDLARHDIAADVFLSFEMLEHLPNPFVFLHQLSERSRCRYLVVTVPYLRRSRVGLHHIRERLRAPISAERTHLFELSPQDWRLVFMHSGWRVRHEQIYRQYPRRSWLRLTRSMWRRLDFEGFYGAVLVRDRTWSSLYQSW